MCLRKLLPPSSTPVIVYPYLYCDAVTRFSFISFIYTWFYPYVLLDLLFLASPPDNSLFLFTFICVLTHLTPLVHANARFRISYSVPPLLIFLDICDNGPTFYRKESKHFYSKCHECQIFNRNTKDS